MSLQPGSRVGPYEIGAEIGAGGMGLVYRARDSRLGRDVAIKVSAERFSDRFELEARAVAALNHPNICTLHDVGPDYLVMELVEGDTLADVLATRAPLPIDEAIGIARQIASALDAAHERGVVHRDLKPGNIKIKAEGTVKVLDFGLAKFDPLSTGADGSTPRNVTNSPTLGATGVGLILGTAAYMSPEQARGKDVDKRADIWAFGVVLYEMVSGRRAFDGEDASTILAAVIKTKPQWDDVPLQVRRLIEKCLQKDPSKRLRDIGDAWDLLEDTQKPSPAAMRSGGFGWVAASVFAVAAAVAIWAPWRGASRPMERPLIRLEVDLGSDVSLPPMTTPTPSSLAISPDGMQLAYIGSIAGGRRRLLMRRLDQSATREIAGTETAVNPFFSLDGQWVGFYDGAKINKVPVGGGAVIPISPIGLFAGATWTDTDDVIAGSGLGKALMRGPAAGGTLTSIVEPNKGENFFTTPQLLPGGRAVLTTIYGTAPSVERALVAVVLLPGGERKTIARGGTSARYLPSGHVVYTNRSAMFAIPFDVQTLEVRGATVPILNDMAFDPAANLAQFDVSATGTIVYRHAATSAFSTAALHWIDATGKTQPLRPTPATYISPRVSHDGKKVAMVVRESTTQDVWVYDTERDAMTRLTFGEAAFVSVAWSPDGRYVIAGSVGDGIFWTRADGGGRPRLLVPVRTISMGVTLSHDGKRVAFVGGPGTPQVWTVPIEEADGLKAGTPERFLSTESVEGNPAFSPDGRWLAYESNESGQTEVYVRAYPASADQGGGKWLISSGGGASPAWAPNGRTLLYRSGDQMMAVDYTVSGAAFTAARPRVWLASLGGAGAFDLAPDGKRLAVMVPTIEKGVSKQEHTVIFVQNFFDELRRRAPPSK